MSFSETFAKMEIYDSGDDIVAQKSTATAPPKKRKIKKAKTTTQPKNTQELGEASPNICPPVKRTFANLGITDLTDRFKLGDVCPRCGHTFSRGMVKEYHYASKNCKEKKPYSKTEIGQKGKEGQHAARKMKQRLGDDFAKMEGQLAAITQFLGSEFVDRSNYPYAASVEEWTSVYDFCFWATNWGGRNSGTFTTHLDTAQELGDPIAQKLRSLCEQIKIDKEVASVKLSIGGRKLGDAPCSNYTKITLWEQLCEYHIH